ncbi:MAG: hypothetical protein LUH09_06505 [Clostridiales bacterium]|nr:hypothetical protein [Clostridiales bacterium]
MENKRIWAMVGVVYMVIIVLLSTYWIATTTLMSGITGIMLFPLCGGMAAQCFNNRWKVIHADGPGNPVIYLLLGIGCTAAALLMLALGIQQVAAALGL